MVKIYALAHPETRVVRKVGYAVNRDVVTNLTRRCFGEGVKRWLDDLPGPPLVVILEEDPDEAFSRRGRWESQLVGAVLPDRPMLRTRAEMLSERGRRVWITRRARKAR